PHSDLWLAAYAGDTDEVRDLIERGADVNELDTDSDKPTPLWAACSTLSWPTAKVLIDAAGANLHAVDSKGNTLAHCAARGGDHETIVELFIRGMNMSQANTHGNTPLHAAAVHNKSEMILTLLDLHAGINTTNIFGSTPLHAAATYGAIQSAGALLHRNAALHIKNSNGRTAMDVARKKKH
ncbi:ankyrin repeat-containing domain protein, partial [Baffinella frigidus]